MSEDYDSAILALRPEIFVELNGVKNEDELFMHQTLRPALKLQHSKIIRLIESASRFEKHKSTTGIASENTNYLKTFLSKNSELKNQLVGIISGVMTENEFNYFIKNKSVLSKRILDMITTRFLSTLH